VDAEKEKIKIRTARLMDRLLKGCSSVLKGFGGAVLVIEGRFVGVFEDLEE
jgi:hypothetical protein